MEFVIGGLAATSAGVITNPLEVVKHQMEISKKSQFTSSRKYSGFVQTGLMVAKRDGLKSLQKGLSPALGAHLTSYGMKLGTYNYCQNRGLTTDPSNNVDVVRSVSCSTVGGLLGQYLSNPFYLLKAEYAMRSAVTPGKKMTYSDIAMSIYKEHGIKGFFRGATTSVPRALIGTSQLTSFAVAKENLNKMETFANNPLITTVLASAVAGLVLSTAMTPFELVLTKMYEQAISPQKKAYSGYLDCVKKIYQTGGLKPFYRGLGPIYVKLGPHTVLCLLFWEELKGICKPGDGSTTNMPESFSTVPKSSFYDSMFNNGTESAFDNLIEKKCDMYWS